VRITLGFAGGQARLPLVSILDSLRPARGLRVLVTAGARGVGAAIARAFHLAGSRVHVCDVDRSALDRLRSEVPGITHSMADVSLSADVVSVFEDVQGTLGGLDVLVGIGGIAGPTGPVETIDGAGWERTIAVNLHSQFHFARRAVPLLKRSLEGGCMVMTASSPGETGDAFRAAAASSTWAVLGLMRSLAVELGPDGVRVNTILLGAGPARIQDKDGSAMPHDPELDDAAALALFLCSPAARNLTGQAVGIHALVPSFSAPP
jgi:NAD(P)-dependent dehydrogenase (short-subunit alcohol dehydrogenase family)